MNVNIKFKTKDLIDLEYFIEQDEGQENETHTQALESRDKDIFSSEIRPLLEESKKSEKLESRFILFKWLEKRRDLHYTKYGAGSILPGEILKQVFNAMLLFVLLFGLFSGAGSAFTFLAYHGKEPVNVSAYFSFFVLLQVVLVCLILIYSIFGSLRSAFNHVSVSQTILGILFLKLLKY